MAAGSERSERVDKDHLERETVAQRIVEVIKGLADAENLPAGRVLAIDAPWGAGKSWLAQRLPLLLDVERERGRALYINAFEFDFHHDPFVVLASAVLDAVKAGPVQEGLKKAAIEVVRSAAPAFAAGAVNTLGEKLAGKEAVEFVKAASSLTDAGLKKLLDSYSASKKSTAAFKKSLRGLADAEPGPFVIVIDELDRCRPTFALEMLERIKHLFDVPNVVFALFIHGEALHSAIRQTYGEGIEPNAYLRKFISLHMGIPRSVGRFNPTADAASLAMTFIDATFARTRTPGQDFRRTLGALAPVFDLTLRDIQTVMMLGQVFFNEISWAEPQAAYVLALRTVDPDALESLRLNGRDALLRELARFDNVKELRRPAHGIRDALRRKAAILNGAPDDDKLISSSDELAALEDAMRRLRLENIGT